ncbi:molybdenum cofactor guanylyltransferase [Devosia sp.]|uniref:molybdenum cofactor guanylyltransferase n=1 Tax=Devosia sp. TaxID=1871048 RepID=UPI003BAB107C
MRPVAAVILAGGRGERLGGAIKSELRVGGERLLDRALAVLAQCSPILVAHGRLDPGLLALPPGVEPIADLQGDYAGPLAGVAAAIDALKRWDKPPAHLVAVAVDSPLLPADYVSRLLEGIGEADAAIASYGGQIYPTNSIWRVAAFADLTDRIVAGTAPHSLKRLAFEVSGREIAWPLSADGDPFANVNTLEDLAELELRAARQNPSRR